MQHIFIAYVEDKPGVLNRVASLFRRRVFNIESLTVGHTEQPGVSRMTIVVDTTNWARGASKRIFTNSSTYCAWTMSPKSPRCSVTWL